MNLNTSVLPAVDARTLDQSSPSADDIPQKLNQFACTFDAAAGALQWGAAILRAAAQTEDKADRRLLTDAADFFRDWSSGEMVPVSIDRIGGGK